MPVASSPHARAALTTALATALLAVAATGQAQASARTPSCAAPHSKTIRSNPAVRLYRVPAFIPDGQVEGSLIKACWRATGRRVRIGERYDDQYVLFGTVDHLVLAGSTVASLQSQTDVSCKADCPPGYQATVTWVQVNDIRTRKQRTAAVQGALPTQGQLQSPLLLSRSGVAAWLDGDPGAARLSTLSTTSGAHLLDQGNIDPASVTLTGATLSWTKDGQPHSASLAPAPAPRARAASTGCHTSGLVLLRRPGVIVWRVLRARSAGRQETVYICSPPAGHRHTLVSFFPNQGASIRHLQGAGHYLAYLYAGDPTVTNLEVADAATGHNLVNDVFSCMGHAGCSGYPGINAFVLSPTGWLAELDSNGQQSGATLFARYRSVATPLDAGVHINRLRVTGTTLTWTADDGHTSSVRLGSQLTLPSTVPAPAGGACGLVTLADARAELGALASQAAGATPERCDYTLGSRSLTVTQRTGLTPAQESAAAAQYTGPDFTYQQGGPTDQLGGSQNAGYFGMPTVAGVVHQLSASYYLDSEVTIDLSPSQSDDDVRVPRVLTIAVDRLLGFTVTRGPA
jgi:hypothetical protein